jgi:Zn finger protein HypA/HybF involved in hydrogenase expression
VISLNDPPGGRELPRGRAEVKAWCPSCHIRVWAVYKTTLGFRCPICKGQVHISQAGAGLAEQVPLL